MVALRNETGSTLLETILCVAIIAMLLGTFTAYSLGKKAYAVRAAVESFTAFVADARAVAQTCGTGATIVIASDRKGGFVASLYPYRPIPGANLRVPAVRTLTANVDLTPTALFISSSGTASAAAWSTANGTLATEPACNTTIALTFGNGVTSEAHAIPCAQARLQ